MDSESFDDEWLDARLADRRAATTVKKGRMARAKLNPLRQVITLAKAQSGLKLDDLTVLAPRNDPYRLATASGERDGQWFGELAARYYPEDEAKQFHNRGAHYRHGSAGDATNSTGKPYKNDADGWAALERGSKCGRWLGYIPFERIKDERNEQPLLFTGGRWYEGAEAVRLSASVELIDEPEMPQADGIEIKLHGKRYHEQPYRIVFYGEKSSLRDVLEAVAREVGGEVLLPTGESSDTLVYGAVARAAADGRPLIIIYIADFDPSGWQMSISVGRKVQALRDAMFPNLKARVFHVGLTREQARDWDLPSTPLKEPELRAARWLEIWGRQQTEIDAAIALVPDKLAKLVRDAVRPFYDPTLERRAAEIWGPWVAAETAKYQAHPVFEKADAAIEEANDRIRDAYEALIDAVRDADDIQQAWVNDSIR